MIRSQYNIVFLLIAFFVAILTYLVSLSTATLAFSLFMLLLGNLFIYFICSKQERIAALNLYYIIYIVYVLLAINHFLGYQADWNLFTQDWLDEYNFYSKANDNQYISVWQNFIESFIDKKYMEYGGYVFYLSFLSSLAHSIFDGNNLLLLLLSTVIFGVLTSIIIFKTLYKYIDIKRAFYYSLIFMFFSVFNFYSFKLLRDVPIAFFYTCGFYLVLNENKKFIHLVFILLLNFLIWQLRFEHGLFFTLITLYFCFKLFRRNKIILTVIGMVAILLFSFVSLTYISRALNTIDRYASFTQEKTGDKEDSFAKYIYKLPPIVKQVGIIINSQVQPFPSWVSLQSSVNIHQAVAGFLKVIYAFFWFIIFFSLVKWLVFERKYTVIRGDLLALGILCLLFLLLNTANMTTRRLIAFYPFLYILYVYIKERLISNREARKTFIYGVYIYFCMVLLYLILKI